ncbi:protein rogdi [Toxorhynchites rutilus septentrionalis]|uniref:protein rogdi n=1 Tax=Toxorhynchites rutilus septentrionalis TaxID=329112 RepID=UPI002479D3FD|nr:protein rogdi [Toxorhynchites rutilus septentrionalis]
MLKFSGPNWFSKPQSRKKSSGQKGRVSFLDQQPQFQVSPPKVPRKGRASPQLLSQISWASDSSQLSGGSSSSGGSCFSRQHSFRHSWSSQHSFTAYSRGPFATRRSKGIMTDTEKEEAINLQVEFEWVLREEVHSVLKQLHAILVECAHRFPVPLYGNEGKKQDKFVLTAAPEQLKCVVTLTGDSITHADINFKVQRQQQQTQRTTITQDYPWKIQQVQDAANHLQQAINHIDNVDSSYNFKTSDEVLHVLGNILGALQRGRTSLVVPRKKPIDELMKSRNMKALSPNLPEDLAISFYIQSHKLIFVAYQLTNFQGTMKFDSCQAECSVPWLNEVLVLFTVALQLCQQLKDKISVFSQYKDFTVGSRSASALSY